MFQTIRNAWKIPELRRKLFYTIMLIVVFRFGTYIPVPFMNPDAMRSLVENAEAGSMFSFLNTFSGGAFAQATIFAMSITPYINASIIMQLLCVAIPTLERMSKEGEQGRKKINQITRYLAVLLGFIQAAGLYIALKDVTTRGVLSFFVMTLTFTAGTAFLMWLGEQISEKGIGNGISILIFAGIVSRGPDMVQYFVAMFQAGSINWISLALVIIAMLLVVAAVVAMNDSERRLPVQYAKRVVGRKMYGGQSTHIPMKLLSAGVIPIIFATSILAFPSTVAQFFGVNQDSAGFMGALLKFLAIDSWAYAILNFLLIIFFTYFYTAIQFNPVEIANNMKKNGGFIPGIRPGKSTSEYVSKILSRITLAGATFLAALAILPIFVSKFTPLKGMSFGGTSLLIVVGVALETTKQIESNMLVRNYKGFLE